jgi:hypothetical protein
MQNNSAVAMQKFSFRFRFDSNDYNMHSHFQCMHPSLLTASVVWWLALQTTNTEVPGSIPGHSLGFF